MPCEIQNDSLFYVSVSRSKDILKGNKIRALKSESEISVLGVQICSKAAPQWWRSPCSGVCSNTKNCTALKVMLVMSRRTAMCLNQSTAKRWGLLLQEGEWSWIKNKGEQALTNVRIGKNNFFQLQGSRKPSQKQSGLCREWRLHRLNH